MRFATLTIIAALTLAPASVFAEDSAPVATAAPAAVNKVDPVTGVELKADAKTVTVKVGEGDAAKDVVIAVADDASAKAVTEAPNKYGPAALANKKYEEAAPK